MNLTIHDTKQSAIWKISSLIHNVWDLTKIYSKHMFYNRGLNPITWCKFNGHALKWSNWLLLIDGIFKGIIYLGDLTNETWVQILTSIVLRSYCTCLSKLPRLPSIWYH